MVRPRVMLPDHQPPAPPEEFIDPLLSAEEHGLITSDQTARVFYTDLILRAQRRETLQYVWIAVEASNKVGAGDIGRSRETADILTRVFEEKSIAVVAGRSIDPSDLQRARAADVVYVELEERW